MSHCPRLTVFTRGVNFINKRKIRAQLCAVTYETWGIQLSLGGIFLELL